MHPGTGDARARAAAPHGWRVRRSDHDFLVSAPTREIVADEGSPLVDHRPLRDAWRRAAT